MTRDKNNIGDYKMTKNIHLEEGLKVLNRINSAEAIKKTLDDIDTSLYHLTRVGMLSDDDFIEMTSELRKFALERLRELTISCAYRV